MSNNESKNLSGEHFVMRTCINCGKEFFGFFEGNVNERCEEHMMQSGHIVDDVTESV